MEDIVVKAIDASIEKWQDVVYNGRYKQEASCPLCDVFSLHVARHEECTECPIRLYTGAHHCHRTTFYASTVWLYHRYTSIPSLLSKAASNAMLLLLHEVRRAYITGKLDVSD